MQSLWILLLSTALIAPGFSLKCYFCNDCGDTDLSNLQPQECQLSTGLDPSSRSLIESMKKAFDSPTNPQSQILEDDDYIHEYIKGSPHERGLLDPVCLKAVYKKGSTHFVNRQCGFEAMCSALQAVYKDLKCYTCNTDGCNGGSRLVAFSLSSLLMSIIFAYIYL